MNNNKSKSNLAPLHPYYVTGFSDGESYFYVCITKSKSSKVGWQVQASYAIGLGQRDLVLLERIQSYFGGIGVIFKQGQTGYQYMVRSLKDLTNVVIPHFDKYSLLTKKQADFVLFKQVIDLVNRQEHLNPAGLQKIVNIKALMNWGLSEGLKKAFPNIILKERPEVLLNPIKDPNWVVGFVDAEGCFYVNVFKSLNSKMGMGVNLWFKVTQHTRDTLLMKNFLDYFACGLTDENPKLSWVNFHVTKALDVRNVIIPFFHKYPLQGAKALDFADFYRVANIMKVNGHLTKEGLEQIIQIKSGMNSKRLVE